MKLSAKDKKILAGVKKIAMLAKKVAKGWVMKGGGQIMCVNQHCTLGAILYHKREAEIALHCKAMAAAAASIKKAQIAFEKKFGKFNAYGGEYPSLDSVENFNPDPKNFGDAFPSGVVAKQMGADAVVGDAVITANDNHGDNEGNERDYRARRILLTTLQPKGWKQAVKDLDRRRKEWLAAEAAY